MDDVNSGLIGLLSKTSKRGRVTIDYCNRGAQYGLTGLSNADAIHVVNEFLLCIIDEASRTAVAGCSHTVCINALMKISARCTPVFIIAFL